jgi:uncharacterized protein (DUF433 family)
LLTSKQIVKLANINLARLRYWERTGALLTELAPDGGTPPYYTFRDAVSVRVLALLRNRGVPLDDLRRTGAWLASKRNSPWSTIRFYVDGKSVYFKDPDTDELSAIRPRGQSPHTKVVRLKEIAHSVRADTAELGRRTATQVGKVEKQRGVMHGKSVIAGTRIPTAAVWDFHKAGYTEEAILREYPQLRLRDVRAAIRHEKRARRAA